MRRVRFSEAPHLPPRQGPRAPHHFKAERNQFESNGDSISGNLAPEVTAPGCGFTPGHAVFLCGWDGGGGVWREATPPPLAHCLCCGRPEAAPARGRRGRGDSEPVTGSLSTQKPLAAPLSVISPHSLAWTSGLGEGDPSGPPRT